MRYFDLTVVAPCAPQIIRLQLYFTLFILDTSKWLGVLMHLRLSSCCGRKLTKWDAHWQVSSLCWYHAMIWQSKENDWKDRVLQRIAGNKNWRGTSKGTFAKKQNLKTGQCKRTQNILMTDGSFPRSFQLPPTSISELHRLNRREWKHSSQYFEQSHFLITPCSQVVIGTHVRFTWLDVGGACLDAPLTSSWAVCWTHAEIGPACAPARKEGQAVPTRGRVITETVLESPLCCTQSRTGKLYGVRCSVGLVHSLPGSHGNTSNLSELQG